VHTACLPGTHSKWVRLERQRIASFRTAMTGELYALLRAHSLLAALMPAMSDSDADDGPAFDAGVAEAARDPVPLASRLFGVRTRGLFGALPPEQAASYLSGLLIGDELRGWTTSVPPQGEAVHLVGGRALVARYARALQAMGVASRVHPEMLAARGLHRLARAR
jgi:2-dehydro-3-deoxygalactonokinase